MFPSVGMLSHLLVRDNRTATAIADGAQYGYVPHEAVAILFVTLYGIILHVGQATYFRASSLMQNQFFWSNNARIFRYQGIHNLLVLYDDEFLKGMVQRVHRPTHPPRHSTTTRCCQG
ncbi:hypothetical protein K438DRAFT_2000262 [Mycena galopus ATCC 62051]|nr:hypothetical protein K438DRAFT_2000262 [Mycena galopus ATCC 62051]